MSLPQRQEALRQRTAEALRDGAAAAPSNGQPVPGALFAFPETADLAVEWAVIAVEEDGHAWVVPADTNPLHGSCDVAVPDSSPAGPLSLRCGFGVSLPVGAFSPALRTGSLAPGDTAAAQFKREAVTAGTLHGDALEREVDTDPEYEDWIEEILEPAREALARHAVDPAPLAVAMPPTKTSLFQPLALAASLLLSIGLAVWAFSLYRTLAALQHPVQVAYEDVNFFEVLRGPETVEVPTKNQRLVLNLRLSEEDAIPDHVDSFPIYVIEILDPGEKIIWTAEGEEQGQTVDFPRSMLTNGVYTFRFFGKRADGQRTLLDEQTLKIDTP